MNNNQNKNLPEPVVIGNLRKQNRGTFGLIIFFLILILFAIFLPNIKNFISNINDKNIKNNISNINNEKDEVVENPTISDDEEIYYEINENTNFVYDNITFASFVLNTNSITFNVSAAQTINLGSRNYYVEFYTIDKTFINRIKIDSINTIPVSTTTVTEEVSANILNNAKFIKIIKIETNTMPEVTLNDNKLTCTLENDEIIYTFENNKLKNIKERLNMSNSNADYLDNLEKYKNYKNNYENIKGINVSFIDTGTSFDFNFEVDYSIIKDDINLDNFYEKDTLAKVINYEMTNKNYSCS